MRRTARDPPPVSLDPIVKPVQFLDPEIQCRVKELRISTEVAESTESVDVEPQSKRRKTNPSQTLLKVTNLLWRLVGLEPQDTLAGYPIALQYATQTTYFEFRFS